MAIDNLTQFLGSIFFFSDRERNRIKDDCFDKAGVEEARKKLNSCSLVEHF